MTSTLTSFPSRVGKVKFCTGFPSSSARCDFGSSTLGLAAIHQHLPPAVAPLATSLVVTTACIFGGVIQHLVGSAIGAPSRLGQLFALLQTTNPDFGTYQRGLLWLVLCVTGSVIASFFFRSPVK